MSLPPLRETIARFGLDARKSLGQHFLLDEAICARIASLAGDLTGRHVIEVGPGPGGLTRALLATPAASVTAVELDPRACAAIAALAAAFPGRLHLVEGDALERDLAALTPAPRQIVANLPYNAGTAMLIRWLHQAAHWERLTLMFQQEVAERICAAPDTPAYGRLAVIAQSLCTAHVLMRLPPGAFTPPPKVHSAVVSLVPHAAQPPAPWLAALERITAAAFGQRRKMLRTALKPLGGAALLAACGIDGARRGETLRLDEFHALAAALLAGAAGAG